MTARLVENIEAQLGPLPPAIRGALLTVDRARFVRPCDHALAYENWPLPLDTPHGAHVPPVQELLDRHGSWQALLGADALRAPGSTVSAPTIYALAFHFLGLGEGQRLLELGAGTGYGAALAASVVGPRGRVTSVEVDPHLVHAARENTAALANVTVLHDDGLARPDLIAAHDRAWLTFSVAELPRALVDALPEGASLLAPVGPPPPAPQRWVHFQRENGAVRENELPFPVMFIPARPLVSAG
jgi:protein-L-isoaspartate(D-aspartate) O-methyltransferase